MSELWDRVGAENLELVVKKMTVGGSLSGDRGEMNCLMTSQTWQQI
jgi:hypothetical protein